jgi:protein-L-isoaspartate O-methyltransferase
MARERRLVFGEVADLYDRARPSYPPALIDELIEYAALAPPARILEIGAGTGKATKMFAERGLGVLALEPDPAMAALARRTCAQYERVSVEQVEFERRAGDGTVFPLVACAQAWHWIEPSTRFVKAREALVDDGTLAVFWSHPEWQLCPLREQLRGAYQRAGVETSAYGPMHPDIEVPALVADWSAEIGAARGFGQPATRSYRWSRDYPTADYLALLQTHSDHVILPPASRAAVLEAVGDAIDEAGGAIRMSYLTQLCLATAR